MIQDRSPSLAPPRVELAAGSPRPARRLGYSRLGCLALIISHVGGMVDFVALPLWVGSLMQSRGLDAQQAGALVTAYVLGVFGGSMAIAPRLHQVNSRLTAGCGFLVGVLAFAALAVVGEPRAMAVLHVLAGIGAGCGLSVTHGAMGRSGNPHRLFGLGNLGTAVFAILFFAIMPGLLARSGALALFLVLAGLMTLAAIAATAGFPRLPALPTDRPHGVPATTTIGALRLLAFLGVACLSTTQTMIFGFVERVGIAHGFPAQAIGLVLLAGGFINLTAPLIASLLERSLSANVVAVSVLPAHGLCGALTMLAGGFALYAVSSVLLVWLVIFGHIFIFSLIAALDPSGRTAATTPAMLMVGSAVGPLLGGTLVTDFGYSSLPVAGGLLATIGCLCFIAIARRRSAVPHPVA